MALLTNDLYAEASRVGLKRIQPEEGPGAVGVRSISFAAAGTYPVGTALYVDVATGLLKVIDAFVVPGATNDVHAFVWPADVVATAAGEVYGTVMLKGAIHYDELEALRVALRFDVTGASTTAKLKDILRRPDVRKRGLVIEGLDKLDTTTTGL